MEHLQGNLVQTESAINNIKKKKPIYLYLNDIYIYIYNVSM